MATQLDTDREQWEAYVRGELAGIEAAGFEVFDMGKLARSRSYRPTSDLAAYMGPWRIVRAYASQEFIWHVEGGASRVTWQEWQSRRRSERSAEREDAADPRHLLEALEYARDLMARRGEMIATLRDAGHSWAAITDASGLSRMQAHTLAAQWRDGERIAAILSDDEPF